MASVTGDYGVAEGDGAEHWNVTHQKLFKEQVLGRLLLAADFDCK